MDTTMRAHVLTETEFREFGRQLRCTADPLRISDVIDAIQRLVMDRCCTATAGAEQQPPASPLMLLTDDELLDIYVPIPTMLEGLRHVQLRVRAPLLQYIANQEDQLAACQERISELQAEAHDLAADRAKLIAILAHEADTCTTPQALRARLLREIEVLDAQIAKQTLQQDDGPLEEADPQHSLMNGHVTPRLYVPTDTVMDDIGSPT